MSYRLSSSHFCSSRVYNFFQEQFDKNFCVLISIFSGLTLLVDLLLATKFSYLKSHGNVRYNFYVSASTAMTPNFVHISALCCSTCIYLYTKKLFICSFGLLFIISVIFTIASSVSMHRNRYIK